jgi:hypothetical protein
MKQILQTVKYIVCNEICKLGWLLGNNCNPRVYTNARVLAQHDCCLGWLDQI